MARLSRAPGGKTRQLCPGSADVALLLGDALDLWFVSLQRRLGVGRGGRDLAPGCRVWPSPSWVRRSWGSGTSRWKGSTWVWAPLVRGVGIDARTTQSPAGRGASPKGIGGRAGQPADAHSNASFAAEVQSNSEAAVPAPVDSAGFVSVPAAGNKFAFS